MSLRDTTRARARPRADDQTTPKRQRLAMSLTRINDTLRKAMERDTSSTDGAVYVCRTTEREWNAFVTSDDPAPALPTKYLQWFQATCEIHIVEFPCAAHAGLANAVRDTFRADANAKRWLRSRGDAFNQRGHNVEPNAQFGPAPRTPGSVLPRPGMAWSDFNTIKVEIGVLRPWGNRAGALDHKALAIWYAALGVEYVLCIKTDDALTSAEFKLYDFQKGSDRRCPGVQKNGTPIVPGTTVAFDAHRILGIPAESPLPDAFPNPFVVDLHEALQDARVDFE